MRTRHWHNVIMVSLLLIATSVISFLFGEAYGESKNNVFNISPYSLIRVVNFCYTHGGINRIQIDLNSVSKMITYCEDGSTDVGE